MGNNRIDKQTISSMWKYSNILINTKNFPEGITWEVFPKQHSKFSLDLEYFFFPLKLELDIPNTKPKVFLSSTSLPFPSCLFLVLLL